MNGYRWVLWSYLYLVLVKYGKMAAAAVVVDARQWCQDKFLSEFFVNVFSGYTFCIKLVNISNIKITINNLRLVARHDL